MIPFRKTLWAGTFSLFLAGCGGGNSGSGSGNPATSQAVLLRGHVHGGQSPVALSAVTLYTVNPGAAATVVTTAQTDGIGDFNLNFTCSSPGLSNSSLLYITSTGGNPGGGNNDALGEMVALGACGNLPAFANITEVTTVAAAYALSGFMSVSGTAPNLSVNVQGSATNGTGIANAFATAAVLADPGTGVAPAALVSSQAPAQQTLYSLANAVAACVNTTGGGSAQCSELFACAVPGAAFDGTSACSGGTSASPADTISAALSVTHNPGLVSIAGIYDTATRNAVFSPALGAAPNDWTLGLHFTGGGLNFPYQIAVDASGDLWVTNLFGNSVSEFAPDGTPVAGSPFTEGGLYAPRGLAIDASGDIWVANASGLGRTTEVSSVTKLDSSGVPVAGSPFTGGGLNAPLGVAIDAQGNVWVANDAQTTFGATELDSSGSPVAGSPFTAGRSERVAIDASGDVWLANEFLYTITKLHADGTAATGSPFSTGGETVPLGIAIDPSGNLWFGNAEGYTAGEFTSSGSPATGSPFTGGGLNYPYATAVDASGNIWMANTIGNSFTELTTGGAPLSGATGFASGQENNPESVAIDASGNVWAANTRGNSISKLIGAATPTRTPLVTTITAGEGFAP